jgi:signal peptidase
MQVIAFATRVARRTLDGLLLLLMLCVVALLVLARVLPAATGGTTFVVGGGSMEPTIPVGSAVLAVPVAPTDLRQGDVVSIRVGPRNAVFTHRVVRVATLPDGIYVETKGDGNEHPDPALLPASSVIGRVSLHIPFVGYGLALLNSINGVTFLIALGIVLLAGAWLLETIEDEQQLAMRRAARQALAAFAPEAQAESRSAT